MSYEYFTEVASSYREAENLVTRKYGGKATITQRRQRQIGGFLGLFRKDAVEVSGFVALEPLGVSRRTSPSRNAAAQGYPYGASPSGATESKLNETALRSRAASANGPNGGKGAGLDAAKQQLLKAAGMNDSVTMTRILAELKNLRDDVTSVTKQQGEQQNGGSESEHQSIAAVRELLDENEFSAKYIEYILKRCRSLSIEDLDDPDLVQERVLEWIGESIGIHEDSPKTRPRVVVLVGPTGVGKTTTIAKLAAQYHLGKIGGAKQTVRILTIDNYRIGAKKQIETYGEIMNIPVEAAESPDDLKKWLDIYHDVDMIFIDTIGRSPNEFETLGKMNTLLQACGAQAEVHLALSACTRSSDIKRIMQQFEPFNYQSVVVTKTDETTSLGTVISSLWEKNKEVSFITYGQSVPHDLKTADTKQFLLRLAGFRIDRQRLDEEYRKVKVE
ncbi:flagellar biosynthesis protein FlhF [Salinispira pacifica]|uniref:Flagellar biosynthesis protein FlhF n=1 Tax=Salinispira pacifica TaxID=1307761 RepID=V5WFL8_9SPIO|nr:flagellar biosynthesis protein FlhF [Salinispira pacifica]AHC14602.1 Flagellar biosynthesis protein FlhF [Salinispira pacifica]